MDKQVPATKVDFKLQYINSIAYNSIFPDFISNDVLWFIGCQFALESDFGRSLLAKSQCNHSGMKKPLRRISYSNLESNMKFAVYSTVSDCIADYLLWLVNNNFTQAAMSDLSLFKVKLRISGYCPEKGYIEKIENIFNQTYLKLL